MSLAAEVGLGIKCDTESPKKKRLKKSKKEREGSEEYTHKIKTAFEPLLKKLFGPLKDRKQKNSLYQEFLVQTLVNYSGFCPSIELDKLGKCKCLHFQLFLLLTRQNNHGLLQTLGHYIQ